MRGAILAGCCLLAGCGGESGPEVAAPSRAAGTGRIGSVAAQDGWSGGFVATSDPRPAEAAARVLAGGGNAVDAAAVALFMLNVVEPQSSGIGGGGFMMIHLAGEGRTLVVDSRETAPAAADAGMFLDEAGQPMPYPLASTSGVAVGVPGALRGVELALARWGTISLADALAPAIAAAEQRVVVDRRLADG
ncbi:MAG TPA: gamma-glutamyltransferase, partial [Rhodospirillales bacterium]|nr:gamma-glutamyltransferase [Rhodospirillales bacterium]